MLTSRHSPSFCLSLVHLLPHSSNDGKHLSLQHRHTSCSMHSNADELQSIAQVYLLLTETFVPSQNVSVRCKVHSRQLGHGDL